MSPLTLADALFGCVACDAAGPTVTMGWQGIACLAMTASVMVRLVALDLLQALFGRRPVDESSPRQGETGSDPATPAGGGAPKRDRRRGQDSPLKRLLKAKIAPPMPFLATFSAVHLGTSEFLRNAAPSLNNTAVPFSVMFKLVLLVQIIPLVLLMVGDFYIGRRYSEQALRRYRAGVMAVALVLVLRQAELYLGTIQPYVREIDALSPIAFPLVALLAASFVCWLAFRGYKSMQSFFAYFAVPAFILMIFMLNSQPVQNSYYDGYDLSEVTPGDASKPPVYVIVFDEFAYEALLDESGNINAELYPNFARLGNESLHLTNANSNYFRTRLQVPDLIDATVPLTTDYELRIYEQTHRIEALYAPGCGERYTCRGQRYLVEQEDTDMTAYLAMRSFYFAVPDWLETAAAAPIHFAVRQVGAPPPPSDPTGMHETTKQLLDLYLANVARDNAYGRIHLLHTLLPHFPFVYDQDGKFELEDLRDFDRNPTADVSEEEYARAWEFYKEQIQYADTFLGQFIAKLEAEGLYEKSVIILTADHGARPVFPIWDEPIEIGSITTNVPMFIRAPNVKPEVSDIEYQHVDFGVTLFDILGHDYTSLSTEIDHEGGVTLSAPVSALDPVRPVRDRIFYVDVYQTGYWRYEYSDTSSSWNVAEAVGSPIPDRTELEGGSKSGDEPLP